jgi:hypothetical protein
MRAAADSALTIAGWEEVRCFELAWFEQWR